MAEPRTAGSVVRSGEAVWRALSVAGASVTVLRADRETGESTVLVRFEPGTRFPAHNHPGGEQVFVLEGDLQIGRDRLKTGDYLYTPPNHAHAASSEGGCVFLVALPKPVEILAD